MMYLFYRVFLKKSTCYTQVKTRFLRMLLPVIGELRGMAADGT